MQRVSELLTPLPQTASAPLRQARKLLNAVRYLDRTLHEIAELRHSESALP